MNNNIGLKLSATLGATALLVALGSVFASPARADRDDYPSYQRDHVYHDISDVRRDERILHDLEDRRDYLRRRRDWDEVHALDRRISDLRRHIDRDRRDIRKDVDQIRRDRDRNRDSDYHYNRDRDYRDRY